MTERISLREEDITSEPGYIIIRLDPDTPQHFENLRKQILDDNLVMGEFEQGWRDIGEYMSKNRISRGKLIGENLLLRDEIKKLKQRLESKS